MASPPRNPEPQPTRAVGESALAADGPAAITRRAPFSDNPHVGARGLRTQQRILDAAMRVFAEDGYHNSSIDRIAGEAACSRASFYQYFSGKDDVFLHLSGTVARQLIAATEALRPLTADLDGWTALRSWIGSNADIYERYTPVFSVVRAVMTDDDETVASSSARWMERMILSIQSKLATTDLPPRQLDPVLASVLGCMTLTFEFADTLRSAAPDAYPSARIEDALTDVLHRTFFGLQASVNVHAAADGHPTPLQFGPGLRDLLTRDNSPPELSPTGAQTLETLLASGRATFVQRGYHGTRIDDITKAAGLSHGAFYRYFPNKHELARSLASQALQAVGTTLDDIPSTAAADRSVDTTALRRWLRRYNATQATETAMIRVWFDASLDGGEPITDAAAAFDWGRRQLARFLRPRDFGDPDTDALIMLALLASFGSRQRADTATDAAAHIIEHGLLGQ